MTTIHDNATKLNIPTTFRRLESSLKSALLDLTILSGDINGPSDSTWQDVAGTASVNLRYLASLLDNARAGHLESCLVFPAPSECLPE